MSGMLISDKAAGAGFKTPEQTLEAKESKKKTVKDKNSLFKPAKNTPVYDLNSMIFNQMQEEIEDGFGRQMAEELMDLEGEFQELKQSFDEAVERDGLPQAMAATQEAFQFLLTDLQAFMQNLGVDLQLQVEDLALDQINIDQIIALSQEVAKLGQRSPAMQRRLMECTAYDKLAKAYTSKTANAQDVYFNEARQVIGYIISHTNVSRGGYKQNRSILSAY